MQFGSCSSTTKLEAYKQQGRVEYIFFEVLVFIQL